MFSCMALLKHCYLKGIAQPIYCHEFSLLEPLDVWGVNFAYLVLLTREI